MPCENDSCKSGDTSDLTSPTQSLDSYRHPQTSSSSILPAPPPPTSRHQKPMSASSSSHTHLSYPGSQQVQESLPSKAFPKQPVCLNLLLQPHIPSQCDLWLNYFPGLPRVLSVATLVRLQFDLHPASRMITCVCQSLRCV